MRSIERRFKESQTQNPLLSNYINFVKAIKGQKFKKQYVVRWFNKLVNKEEFEDEDKKILITHIYLLNMSEDNQK